MGCGASTAVVKVGSRGRTKFELDPDPVFTKSDTVAPLEGLCGECHDECASLQSSAGATSISCVTSLNSRPYLAYKGSWRNDDGHSDVPVIAESVADMQDLADICSRAGDICDFPSSGTPLNGIVTAMPGSFREHESMANFWDTGTIIDSRPHPLAPMTSMEFSTEASHDACVMDIGRISDIPSCSMGDDQSIASSAEDIVVRFPNRVCSPGYRVSSYSRRGGSPTSSVCSRVQPGKLPRSVHVALGEGEGRTRQRKKSGTRRNESKSSGRGRDSGLDIICDGVEGCVTAEASAETRHSAASSGSVV